MKGFALCAIVAVALVATAQADAKYDAEVYFKKHFPNKLDKMDKLFEQYKGKEDQLMKTLIKNRATVVVTTHYSKYKPSRGSKVREIIAAANLGGSKEKKEKRKPNPSGNNKKKR